MKQRKIKLIESLLREDKFYKPITPKLSSIKIIPTNNIKFNSNTFKSSFKKFIEYFKSNNSKKINQKKTFKIIDKDKNKIEVFSSINDLGKSILTHLDNNNIISLSSIGMLYEGILSNKTVWFTEKIEFDNPRINSLNFYDIEDVLNPLKNKLSLLEGDFYLYEIVLISKSIKKEDNKFQDKIDLIIKNWDETAWASDDPKKDQEQRQREKEIKDLSKFLNNQEKNNLKLLLKKRFNFNLE